MDEFGELKTSVTEILEAQGVLGRLKAELRAAVFTAIQDAESNKTTELDNPHLKLLQTPTTGPVILGLLVDTLESLHLTNTLSCLRAEAAPVFTQSKTRKDLIELVGEPESNDAPVLHKLIQQIPTSKPKESHAEVKSPSRYMSDSFEDESFENSYVSPNSPQTSPRTSRTAELGLSSKSIQDELRRSSEETAASSPEDVDDELEKLLAAHTTDAETSNESQVNKPEFGSSQPSKPVQPPVPSSNPVTAPILPQPAKKSGQLAPIVQSNASSNTITTAAIDVSSSFENSTEASPLRSSLNQVNVGRATEDQQNGDTSRNSRKDLTESYGDDFESTSEVEEDLALSIGDSRSLDRSEASQGHSMIQHTNQNTTLANVEQEIEDAPEDEFFEKGELWKSEFDMQSLDVVEKVE